MTAVLDLLERASGLDRLVRPVQSTVSALVRPRLVRNLLSGTPLGHPAHPALTDLPVGAWLGSAVLDRFGGQGAETGADLLVGAGLLAAVPTALSGFNDWSDTLEGEARVGLVHAAANSAAVVLYGLSWLARRSGRRPAGRALASLGLGALMGGAYLGGHLSFVRGVNVNHTAFEQRPSDWTEVAAEADVALGSLVRVTAAGAPVLLHRSASGLFALADTCTHLGGPLHEGKVEDGCVTCPWHGSAFRLDTGRVVRGPATVAAPRYEVRIRDGRVEVRAAGG